MLNEEWMDYELIIVLLMVSTAAVIPSRYSDQPTLPVQASKYGQTSPVKGYTFCIVSSF